MDSVPLLLPGDVVPQDFIANKNTKSTALTIGPGLQYRPPADIHAVNTGLIAADQRKNTVWLETNGSGRYIPAVGDLVVATVHHSSMDFYHLTVTPHTALATLPQLSFEGATKKTRPFLPPGSLVYARVSLANKHMDPELECIHPQTAKSDGLGELKGGMVFDISLGLARRMMMLKVREEGRIAMLEELAEKGLRFEVAVGRNGRLWVQSESIKTALLVGKAVQETDSNSLNIDQQLELARKLVSV